jgi:hypothetical protein
LSVSVSCESAVVYYTWAAIWHPFFSFAGQRAVVVRSADVCFLSRCGVSLAAVPRVGVYTCGRRTVWAVNWFGMWARTRHAKSACQWSAMQRVQRMDQHLYTCVKVPRMIAPRNVFTRFTRFI